MIIDRNKKIVFIEVPKTGTTSIRGLINRSENKYLDKWSKYDAPMQSTHAHYEEVIQFLMPSYPYEYEIYAFYRDPIERFKSGWRYTVENFERDQEVIEKGDRTTKRNRESLFSALEKNKLMKKYHPQIKNFAELQPEELLEIVKTATNATFPWLVLFDFQNKFYGPFVRLLDFREYRKNFELVLNKFNLPIPEGDIKSNESRSNEFTFSEYEKRKIKEHYKADYEYFNARGISFD